MRNFFKSVNKWCTGGSAINDQVEGNVIAPYGHHNSKLPSHFAKASTSWRIYESSFLVSNS